MDERVSIVNVETDDQDRGKLEINEKTDLASRETNDWDGETRGVDRTTVCCVVGGTIAVTAFFAWLAHEAIQNGRNVKLVTPFGDLEIT